jgi:adenosylhomocysteine nucleosidase
MIGIIGAMEEEVEAIKKHMIIEEERMIIDSCFYIGKIENQPAVLSQSGIGKVNAAISTTLLLLNYDITYVINVGSAGGLHTQQEVGDIVISTGVVHHDVDVTAFGYEIGQVPKYATTFLPDAKLLDTATCVINTLELSAHQGIIVSGDQFISKEKQVETIKTTFPDALCTEMEAAAIGQTCHKFNTPFIILRSLSDVFNKGESAIQFDEYLKKASKNSALICQGFIKELYNEQ